MAKLVSSFNKFFENIFLDIRSVNPIQTILEIFDGKFLRTSTFLELHPVYAMISGAWVGMGGGVAKYFYLVLCFSP